MRTTDLPELRFLDEAARAANYGGWEQARRSAQAQFGAARNKTPSSGPVPMNTQGDFSLRLTLSMIAHARTLQKLAELEAEIAAWVRTRSFDYSSGEVVKAAFPVPSVSMNNLADAIERGEYKKEGPDA